MNQHKALTSINANSKKKTCISGTSCTVYRQLESPESLLFTTVITASVTAGRSLVNSCQELPQWDSWVLLGLKEPFWSVHYFKSGNIVHNSLIDTVFPGLSWNSCMQSSILNFTSIGNCKYRLSYPINKVFVGGNFHVKMDSYLKKGEMASNYFLIFYGWYLLTLQSKFDYDFSKYRAFKTENYGVPYNTDIWEDEVERSTRLWDQLGLHGMIISI